MRRGSSVSPEAPRRDQTVFAAETGDQSIPEGKQLVQKQVRATGGGHRQIEFFRLQLVSFLVRFARKRLAPTIGSSTPSREQAERPFPNLMRSLGFSDPSARVSNALGVEQTFSRELTKKSGWLAALGGRQVLFRGEVAVA